MNKSTSTSALIGFAVIAALLTGCTATADTAAPAKTSKPAASAAATNAPAATAPAVTYELADGTTVDITEDTPLAEAIVTDLEVKLSAINPNISYTPTNDEINDSIDAGIAFEEETLRTTGKTVIAVFPAASTLGEHYWSAYPSDGTLTGENMPWTKEMAIASAERFLASESNPNNFVIVVSR